MRRLGAALQKEATEDAPSAAASPVDAPLRGGLRRRVRDQAPANAPITSPVDPPSRGGLCRRMEDHANNPVPLHLRTMGCAAAHKFLESTIRLAAHCTRSCRGTVQKGQVKCSSMHWQQWKKAQSTSTEHFPSTCQTSRHAKVSARDHMDRNTNQSWSEDGSPVSVSTSVLRFVLQGLSPRSGKQQWRGANLARVTSGTPPSTPTSSSSTPACPNPPDRRLLRLGCTETVAGSTFRPSRARRQLRHTSGKLGTLF